MSQCNQCRQTPCECMDVDEMERDVATETTFGRITKIGLYSKLAAKNKSLDVLARGERAMVDTARDVIAELRAKLSECAAMGLEACRRLGVQDAESAALRAKLDAVTAQRDELREAATDFVSRVSNVVPVDSFGHRKTSLQRLRAALEAAR